ncbi:GAP family protein [Kitasatospora arboriphila]|uniref:GAP family protein n=1 Tax=Kitasatospora arboriphila TaxID=258052 RepID=A0ABP4E8G4_9ACTN
MVVDLVVIGTAITLGPLHNSAFILLLSSQRGARKGLAFVLSWLANLVAVVVCVLLLTGGTPPARHSTPSTAADAAELAMAPGRAGYAVSPPRRPPGPHGPPRWTARVDKASLGTAAGLAWLLQPWALVGAGAAVVVDADLSSLTDWIALIVYCLLATLSLAVMEVFALRSPAAANARLNALRTWLTRHQERLIVTLSLVVGLYLTARGIYQLIA